MELSWEKSIIEQLYDLQVAISSHGCADMDVRTEHKRGSTIFRGHPKFRHTGQWNDWAMFDWGNYGQLACEIWCFVDLSDFPVGVTVQFFGSTVHPGVYAVVESTTACPNNDIHGNLINDLELFTPIIKEVDFDEDGDICACRFWLADVEAIVEPVCVIPDIGNTNRARYFGVLPRKDWANQFKSWLMQPHSVKEDQMDDD